MGDASKNGKTGHGGYEESANSASGYAPYPGYAPPKPGDPISVPGYPDGTFSFGGWSGTNAYYLNNATGQSIWAAELFGPPRPDPKLIGAAIGTWEREQKQWHYYYQQQAEYAQMAYQGAPSSDAMASTGWEQYYAGGVSDGTAYPAADAAVTTQATTDSSAHPPTEVDSADDGRRPKKARVENGTQHGPKEPGEGALGSPTRFPSGHAAASVGGTIRFGTVYVWDLDETLIVFNSLLTGAFMDARRSGDGKNKGMSAEHAKALSSLAEQIEDLVYTVAERAFFFKQLEGRNRRCFGAALAADDGRDLTGYDFAADGLLGLQGGEGQNRDAGEASPEEERKVAWRYRVVRDLYAAARAQGAAAAASPLLPQEREAAEAATEAVDALADNWLSTAEEVLASIWQYEAILDRLPYTLAEADADADAVFHPDAAAAASAASSASGGGGGAGGGGAAAGTRSDVNVLVTNGELLPTVAKLLLFGLAKHFHPSCIYSSRDAGKEVCFREVVRRFGAGAADMVAVGDGAEEEAAAVRCGMRFFKVASAQDLRRVRDLTS